MLYDFQPDRLHNKEAHTQRKKCFFCELQLHFRTSVFSFQLGCCLGSCSNASIISTFILFLLFFSQLVLCFAGYPFSWLLSMTAVLISAHSGLYLHTATSPPLMVVTSPIQTIAKHLYFLSGVAVINPRYCWSGNVHFHCTFFPVIF